jgi:hypothetical protein
MVVVRDARIGRLEAIASKSARLKPSHKEGNIKISAFERYFGMFLGVIFPKNRT